MKRPTFNPKHLTQIPQGFLSGAMADSRLPNGAKIVLVALTDVTHRFHGREGGEDVRLSYSVLESTTDLSRRYVIEAVEVLEQCRYIAVERGKGVNEYRVLSRTQLVNPSSPVNEGPLVNPSSPPSEPQFTKKAKLVNPSSPPSIQELSGVLLSAQEEILDDKLYYPHGPSKDADKVVGTYGTLYVEDRGRIWHYEEGDDQREHYVGTGRRLVLSKLVDARLPILDARRLANAEFAERYGTTIEAAEWPLRIPPSDTNPFAADDEHT